MKMRKSEHFVRSSSTIAGQAFNVKMTDKLFETLFSSLYKFKEAAALRETLCNAIDSHNMRDRMQRYMASHYAPLTPPPAMYSKHLAPKGTRVQVHLPDDYEPWLEIKDFGVGLPLESIIGSPIEAREDEVLIVGNVIVKEDEIPEGVAVIGEPGFYEGQLVFRGEDGEIIRSPGLYTTLFNSTKEDDDGQIGAYGLGSKSPFAVSDSFTVESRWEGKLHRFLMYLNANRIPTVDLITKDLDTRDPLPEDTDEFNGLTVKVPVKNSRFRSFSDELKRLGRVIHPNARPQVENAGYGFHWEGIQYDNRIGRTFIQPKNGYDNTHYAVMGGVSYPIDIDQLEEDISAVLGKFPSSYTFFDLGELNVPPSREDLTYDDYTRANLNKEFHRVSRNIMDQKIGELREAEGRGPMALYIKKMQLSELFGSGFRKLMEKQFPADERFVQGKFVYKGTPELVRNEDYGDAPPFRFIGIPYTLEVHESGWNMSEEFTVNRVHDWTTTGKTVGILVENSLKARNLKINTAKKNYDVVIVLTMNDDFMKKRNLLKNAMDSFKNSEELIAYFTKWIGGHETVVDHLAFADAFVDAISDLFDPTDVVFMNEMKYDVPPVEKDPGLYPFEHSFRMEYYNKMSGDEASKLIEAGMKIIYVEFSSRDCIHEIKGSRIREKGLRDLVATMTAYRGPSGENLFKLLGAHPTVMMAMRKSVPMMKKFPEIFIPVDAVFDMLMDYYKKDLLRARAYTKISAAYKINMIYDRMSYGDHLVKEAGIDDMRHHSLYSRAEALSEKAKEIIPPHELKALRKLLKSSGNNPGWRKFVSFLSEQNIRLSKEERIVKCLDHISKTFDAAGDYLTSHGFKPPTAHRVPSKTEREHNRRKVDILKAVRFLRENFEPSKINPAENEEDFFCIISNALRRA